MSLYSNFYSYYLVLIFLKFFCLIRAELLVTYLNQYKFALDLYLYVKPTASEIGRKMPKGLSKLKLGRSTAGCA